MKIFKKVTLIKSKYYKICRIYIFDHPFFQYMEITKRNKNKKFYQAINNRFLPKNNQRIFYLKVHRQHKTSVDCIKHWVEIAEAMNGFIYFICDNKNLQREILKKITFKKRNFNFIKSDRKTLKNVINKILHNVLCEKLWKRIAFSMLTPFIHAAKHNYLISYNIDADDILLLLQPQQAAAALINAEKYASVSKLDLLNIDMFVSKTFGIHWSFGAVLCLNPQKCIDTVKQNINWRKNTELINKYKLFWINKYNFNIDWFFTFLRDTEQLDMRTFYIENAGIVHMPDCILNHESAFMLQWQKGKINFPILRNFYERKVWETIPIASSCIKIDININPNDYKTFLTNFYDKGLIFEFDMIDYAKRRELIPENLYKQYVQIKEFLKV